MTNWNEYKSEIEKLSFGYTKIDKDFESFEDVLNAFTNALCDLRTLLNVIPSELWTDYQVKNYIEQMNYENVIEEHGYEYVFNVVREHNGNVFINWASFCEYFAQDIDWENPSDLFNHGDINHLNNFVKPYFEETGVLACLEAGVPVEDIAA